MGNLNKGQTGKQQTVQPIAQNDQKNSESVQEHEKLLHTATQKRMYSRISGNADMNPDAVSQFVIKSCIGDPVNNLLYRFPAHPSLCCRRFRPNLYSEFFSGSSAELYIHPVGEYFGDVDVMKCRTDSIVVSDDYPSMPSDVRGFIEKVHCFKIAGNDEFPGYCLLLLTGYLKYNWDSEEYKFQAESRIMLHSVDRDRLALEANEPEANREVSRRQRNGFTGCLTTAKFTGAALQLHSTLKCYPKADSKAPSNHRDELILITDTVYCIWCPHWPLVASDWPNRQRHHGWPDDIMIQNIVRYGCHVVHAWHPECSDILKTLQMRLSFSYAEIILLRSWSPIQQVVYHMLRMFAKTELIGKNYSEEEKILTGYHLKTIMLWTCENKSSQWWNTAPVVHLLSQILLDLSHYVKRRNIPNYFIPKANLLRKNLHEANLMSTIETLVQFSNFAYLSYWFQVKYVTVVCQKFYVKGIATIGKSEVRTCIAKMIDESGAHESIEILDENVHHIIERCINFASTVNETGPRWIRNHESCLFETTADIMLQLVGRDSPWQYRSLCRSVLLLYGEYSVSCGKTTCHNEFFSDLIRGIPMESKCISEKSHNFPPTYRSKLSPSVVLLLRAQEVMEAITTPTNTAEFQLLARISLMLLKECLATNDPESDSVRCAASAYMASLFYALSDYQIASDLSSMITLSRGPTSKTEARALNVFCLLFIDDVARITGFYLLCEKCQNPSNCSRLQLHLLRLTPHIFAEYLIVSSTRSSPKYSKLNGECNISKAFPLDCLLMFLSRRRHHVDSSTKLYNFRRCVYLRNDTVKIRRLNIGEGKISNLLFQWSIDEMVEFADILADKNSIIYDAVTVYRALLMFKRRQYVDVIKACENILSDTRTPELPEITHYAKVTIVPPFHGFFDKNIQFLLGLQTLCHYFYSYEHGLFPEKSVDHFRWWSAGTVQEGSILSYRMCPCIRDQYVLTGCFVAKYLLLRITIAEGTARSKVFAAYRQMKSRWPFEKIIHRFLYQQLERSIRSGFKTLQEVFNHEEPCSK